MKSIDELSADLSFTTAKYRRRPHGDLPARAPARRAPLHRHLGRRPHRRAARHVRRAGAEEVRRPGTARRRHRRRRPDLDVRRAVTAERRLQRGRRPAGVRVRLRTRPVRRNAPRRMGHPRARQGHGPQRRLRVAELPVVSARFRRPAATAGDQPTATSPWRRSGHGTTGTSRHGQAPIPTASFPANCHGFSIPTSARR